MLFSAVLALASAAIAYAADIRVLVGDGGALAFTPPNITAQSGDNVIFEFRAKNHSVTQSTFAKPCSQMTTPNQGVDSGFQPVAPGSTLFPSWNITVDDPSAPLWFFCAQTVPANHCNSGMVFAINPTAEKSFDAFQTAAKASTPGASGAAPVPSGGVSSGVAGASSAYSIPPLSTVSNPTGGSSTTIDTNTPTSAATSAPEQTADSGALRVTGSAGSLVALAGLVVGLMM